MVFGKNGVEEPDFELMHKTPDGLEVRHYTQSSVIAYTACPGGVGSSDTSDAFRTLARYIGVFSTPQNFAVSAESPQSIRMTAPVLMTGSDQAQNDQAAPQSISMTAPVLMSNDATGSCRSSTATTMAFVLPSRQVLHKCLQLGFRLNRSRSCASTNTVLAFFFVLAALQWKRLQGPQILLSNSQRFVSGKMSWLVE